MYRIMVLLCLLALGSAVLVQPAFAQGTPPTGFVNKLGLEIDVRSGGRILEDDLSAGNVIPRLYPDFRWFPSVCQSHAE